MTQGTKYHSLFEHLLFSGQDLLLMTFPEVEAVIQAKLPPSAHTREEWWSNSPRGHSQASAWMRAGYRASKIDLNRKTVTFTLKGWPERYSNFSTAELGQLKGLSESVQEKFEMDAKAEPKLATKNGKVLLADLQANMAGLITLAPDYDPSAPLDKWPVPYLGDDTRK
jgi:hypothetical protein